MTISNIFHQIKFCFDSLIYAKISVAKVSPIKVCLNKYKEIFNKVKEKVTRFGHLKEILKKADKIYEKIGWMCLFFRSSQLKMFLLTF